MHTLGIVKRKGGVGATTLAVHLAVESERRGAAACIVDLDPQRSATVWADARQQLTPPVAGVDVGQLGAVLDAARGDGVTLAILDSPPALDRGPHRARRAVLQSRRLVDGLVLGGGQRC